MKKIVLFIVFLSFTFGLAACNKEIDFELEPPTNVAINNGVVSWDAVDQADHYIVFIDTAENEVQTTSFDLKSKSLAVGSYSISVVAVKDDKLSLPSTVLTYLVEEQGSGALLAPTNVSISTTGVVTWNSVSGATSYTVHVGSLSFPTTTTTFNLKNQNIPEGTHSVYVIAKAGTKVSVKSTNVSYTVELNVSQNAIKLALLKIVDQNYALDLKASDFANMGEYNDYLDALSIVEAYSASAILIGLNQVQAVGLFTTAELMVNNSSEGMSLAGLMVQLNMFSIYEMDANDLANMIYELALAMMDINIRDHESEVMYMVDELADVQLLADAVRTNATFMQAHTYMKGFAQSSEKASVDKLFAGGYYELTSAVYAIREMLMYGGETVTPEMYGYGDPEIEGHIANLISVITAMNADVAGKAFLQDLETKFIKLNELNDHQNLIDYYNMDIASYGESIVMLEDLIDSFTVNKVSVIASIEVVVDFALTVQSTIPENVIDLLDDFMLTGELTQTEMFTIKDELVLVLQTALPTAADFETLYNTMFIIAGDVSGTSMTAYLQYADMMGQAHYMSIDLALALLADIDETLINQAKVIIEGAEDEFGSVDFDNNPEVAIDLALFVLDYLETFVADNQLKINAMNALISDQFLEEMYVMALDFVISEVEKDTTLLQAEIDMYVDFLEEMQLEFDTYKAVVDIFGKATSDVLHYLIDSDMKLLKSLIMMDQLNPQQNPLDQTTYLTELAVILGELNMIDGVVFDEITGPEVESLLNAVRLPLKLVLEAEGYVIDYDTMYTELMPEFKTVILNMITLQTVFMVEADQAALVTIVLNENLTYEMGEYVAIITIASGALTNTNEMLILETLDIIYDDILGHASVLVINNVTAQDVIDEKALTVLDVQAVIDEFQALGLLDFNALSPEDEIRINDFMMGLQ